MLALSSSRPNESAITTSFKNGETMSSADPWVLESTYDRSELPRLCRNEFTDEERTAFSSQGGYYVGATRILSAEKRATSQEYTVRSLIQYIRGGLKKKKGPKGTRAPCSGPGPAGLSDADLCCCRRSRRQRATHQPRPTPRNSGAEHFMSWLRRFAGASACDDERELLPAPAVII